MTPTVLSPWEIAAREFEQQSRRRWATPGELAKALDPKTVQTPALDLIDVELVRLLDTPDGRLIISMPPQEGKPVAVDALVLMGDGTRKPLGQVRVGDRVITHRGRPRTVTAVHEQGVLPVVTITTRAGRTLKAAPDHPVLTTRGWVNAGDLRVGDVLAVAAQPTIEGQATLTAEEARLLGYLTGAGFPACERRVGVPAGDPLLHWDVLWCTGALRVDTVDDQANGQVLLNGGQDWLTAHGVSVHELESATSRRVPAALFTQPAWLVAEFLGALIAAAGRILTRDGQVRVELASPSRTLLADVQHLLLRCGIDSTLTPDRLLVDRPADLARLRDRVPIRHQSARQLAYVPEDAVDTTHVGDPVTAVTRGETAECRCLTVADDHTFTAEDVVVHNSQRISRRFPLWVLTQRPDTRIAIASYELGVARRWGRVIRDDIYTHGHLLGLRVRDDLAAQHEWQLEGHEGGVYSVGIGGALTGRPVDLLVIDDPIKDRVQADSPTYRERVWDWWLEVGSTRLAPGAPVVLVLTRWHEDDLAGRLLAAEDGHLWRVVNIPAQADHDPAKGETDPLGRAPGEYLISARGRTPEQWEAIKIRSGSRTWAALYQGRPAPAEGDVFKRGWWRFYTQPRWAVRADGAHLVTGADEVIQSWDMTFKDGTGSDYVVGQVWGRWGIQVYLLDQVRARMTFTEARSAVRELAAKWPQAVLKLVEDKANGPAVINSLSRTVPGLVPEEPHGSKLARASAIAPFVEAGQVWLPAPEIAPWVGDLVEECAAFPNAQHDDQVDAMSQALNRLLLSPLLAGDLVVDMADLDEELEEFEISPY